MPFFLNFSHFFVKQFNFTKVSFRTRDYYTCNFLSPRHVMIKEVKFDILRQENIYDNDIIEGDFMQQKLPRNIKIMVCS